MLDTPELLPKRNKNALLKKPGRAGNTRFGRDSDQGAEGRPAATLCGAGVYNAFVPGCYAVVPGRCRVGTVARAGHTRFGCQTHPGEC